MVFWIELLKELGKVLGLIFGTGVVFLGGLWLLLFFSDRRELMRLAQLRCDACQRLFGFAAARDAKIRYEQQCKKAYEEIVNKDGETVFVDFDNLWDVECSHCGKVSTFDSLRRELSV